MLRIIKIAEVPDDRAGEFTWLEPDEVRAVLDTLAGNRQGTRDRFLVSLLYSSGGRIGEVLSLRVSDLRPTGDGEADVHFFGKGNKHRVVPLPAEPWSGFQAYAAEYLPSRRPLDLVFYVERRGERREMSRDNVERILRDCEADLRGGAMPGLQHLRTHLFRRSRAMHLYQAGVSLATIQELLGHSQIETTRFYAKVTEMMKRDALSKLAEGDQAVFSPDVEFKHATDDDMLRRLCGLG